jgi:hypothetical protein
MTQITRDEAANLMRAAHVLLETINRTRKERARVAAEGNVGDWFTDAFGSAESRIESIDSQIADDRIRLGEMRARLIDGGWDLPACKALWSELVANNVAA